MTRLVTALLAALPLSASALSIGFSPVVSTLTPIPGGIGNFVAYPDGPTVSAGMIAFTGAGAGQLGIYMFPPQPIFPPSPVKVADLNTLITGGTGTFTAFPTGPIISGFDIGSVGAGAGGQSGIYFYPPGPVIPGVSPSFPDQPIKVADLTTVIPNTELHFTSFSPFVSVDGQDVAFIGSGGGVSGVYALIGGTLTALADTGTFIPNGVGTFVQFPDTPIRIVNQSVAFIANGTLNQTGVYVAFPPGPITPDGPPVKVADTNTIVAAPGDVTNLEAFTTVSYDGTFVAFAGRGPIGVGGVPVVAGVYKSASDGTGAYPPGPARVADTFSTPVPGGLGNFLRFGAVVVDPGVVAFEGVSSDGAGGERTGIYTDAGGTLTKIIATGDDLGGKTVTQLRFGPGGFSDGQVVFAATFTDGSQGISTASFCTGIDFAGFDTPIGGADATGGTFADPIRAFKLKSTVPVKMTLSCGGEPVVTGTHTIQLVKVSSATDSDVPIDATPTDAATSGNQFRLTDAATGAWHFNVDTKRLSKGTWQLKATLSDGSSHSAVVELK